MQNLQASVIYTRESGYTSDTWDIEYLLCSIISKDTLI